jgi:hypothetical protein
VLHLSEHAAYGRIEAARLARRFPVILERLAEGSLTLTNSALLGPHLTAANHHEVLDAARHKTKREIEQLVAGLHPQPAVPSTIRKLPAPESRAHEVSAPVINVAGANGGPSVSPPPVAPAPSSVRPALVQALAPERYKVQFTVSRETHDKLRRVQALLRHAIPDGDVAIIFEKALTLLIADIEKKKLALTERPRAKGQLHPRSRRISARVRREVWARDGGQCAFVGTQGRCDERGFLEFHHVKPYAAGGLSIAENLQLRCRAHNAYEAEVFFGGQPPLVSGPCDVIATRHARNCGLCLQSRTSGNRGRPATGASQPVG